MSWQQAFTAEGDGCRLGGPALAPAYRELATPGCSQHAHPCVGPPPPPPEGTRWV